MKLISQPNASRERPVRPQQKAGLTARNLAKIAFALWMASLFLVGLGAADSRGNMMGFEILLYGWFGILAGNFAWLANPLFLWIFFRISSNKPSTGMAVFCIVLALDTARFDGLPSTLSGPYSYGWGAVLWLTAFCIVLAAAGTLETERAAALVPVGRRRKASQEFNFATFMGLALALWVVMLAGIFHYQDHAKANPAELARLGSAAFKKHAVCTALEPTAMHQIDIANGAVEVVLKNNGHGTSSFDNPTKLLEWGLPRVRYDDRDYYIGQLDGKNLTFSEPAAGAPIAQLFVTSGSKKNLESFAIKLVAGNQVVFDQTWLSEPNASAYCAGFVRGNPGADDQPRKLLMDSLRVGAKAPVALVGEKEVKQADSPPTVAKIVTVKVYPDRPVPNGRGGMYDPRPKANPEYSGTRDCPDQVGWVSSTMKRIKTPSAMEAPFLVGEKMIFLGDRKRRQALCQGSFVYLSTPLDRYPRDLMLIEKKSLPDFQTVWKVTVAFDEQIVPAEIEGLILSRVIETDKGVNFTVINEKNWTEVELVLPVIEPFRP